MRLVAYKAGAKWAEAVQRTAGPAARLKLMPDRREIAADGSVFTSTSNFPSWHVEDTQPTLIRVQPGALFE